MISSPNMIETNGVTFLVFAKDGATESAISKCTPAYSANDNPNTIAFRIRANTPTATVGTAPTMDYSNLNFEEYGYMYSLTPGSSTISLTIDTASADNTYGPNDTKGAYTASITVTQLENFYGYYDD